MFWRVIFLGLIAVAAYGVLAPEKKTEMVSQYDAERAAMRAARNAYIHDARVQRVNIEAQVGDGTHLHGLVERISRDIAGENAEVVTALVKSVLNESVWRDYRSGRRNDVDGLMPRSLSYALGQIFGIDVRIEPASLRRNPRAQTHITAAYIAHLYDQFRDRVEGELAAGLLVIDAYYAGPASAASLLTMARSRDVPKPGYPVFATLLERHPVYRHGEEIEEALSLFALRRGLQIPDSESRPVAEEAEPAPREPAAKGAA